MPPTGPVVLVWPSDIARQSALYPPLGLAYLAAALRRAGERVRVLDLSFDPTQAALRGTGVRGGIWGLSFTTSMFADTRRAVATIREVDPDAVIVLGGPHVTVLPESTFEELDADVACLGEAEETFPALVATLRAGGDPAGVPGVAFRRAGALVRTPAQAFPEDIDRYPVPDPSDFPLERYFALKGYRELSMYTSRGCPARCTFCQPTLFELFGTDIRAHSTERILHEMEWLQRRFSLDLVVMSDDTFAIHKPRVHALCEALLSRNTPLFWRVQTRVRGLDRPTIRLMKQAGCVLMAFGVESGEQRVLNEMKKGVRVEEIEEVFAICHEEGVLTHAYLMVGNPGESEATIEKTEALLRRIRPFSSNVSVTTPYPGTTLYDRARAAGLLKGGAWEAYDHILSSEMHLPLDGVTLADLARFKERLYACQDHDLQRVRDLGAWAADHHVRRRLRRVLRVNPGFALRATRLVGRSLVKTGFELTNPVTQGGRGGRGLSMWPGVRFRDAVDG